jgi:hypothetical protein
MKAYAIPAETIKDQAMFDTYRKEVPHTDRGARRGKTSPPKSWCKRFSL